MCFKMHSCRDSSILFTNASEIETIMDPLEEKLERCSNCDKEKYSKGGFIAGWFRVSLVIELGGGSKGFGE